MLGKWKSGGWDGGAAAEDGTMESEGTWWTTLGPGERAR